MPDIETVIEIGAWVVGLWGGNKAVKVITGKSAVEHAVDAWYRLRDRITAWLAKHPEMVGRPLVMRAVQIVDNTAVKVMRVTVAAKIEATRAAIITEEDVPEEEMLARFPQLAKPNAKQWISVELEQLS